MTGLSEKAPHVDGGPVFVPKSELAMRSVERLGGHARGLAYPFPLK